MPLLALDMALPVHRNERRVLPPELPAQRGCGSGVAETAEQAAATARDLIAMFDVHRQQIAGLGRAAPLALRVHELIQASPIVTIQTVSERLAVSFPTASTALENLAKIGVVRETTRRQRGRIYAYSDYLALLDRGTDPLSA